MLPKMIRIAVRDGATGQVLTVSTAAIVHVNMPTECARARNASACLNEKLNAQQGKPEGATL
jgi:general secretion pathway protein J